MHDHSEYFVNLQTVLLGILKGEVPSGHHRVFTSGTRREKQQLKFGEKVGPLKNWPPEEVNGS